MVDLIAPSFMAVSWFFLINRALAKILSEKIMFLHSAKAIEKHKKQLPAMNDGAI